MFADIVLFYRKKTTGNTFMWSHLRSLWPFYTLYKCHKIIIIFFVLRLKIFIIYRTTYRNNQKIQKCATVIRRCSKLSYKTNLVENFIKCIFSSLNSKFVNKQRANDQFIVNQRNYKYVFHILIHTSFSYNFSSRPIQFISNFCIHKIYNCLFWK